MIVCTVDQSQLHVGNLMVFTPLASIAYFCENASDQIYVKYAFNMVDMFDVLNMFNMFDS